MPCSISTSIVCGAWGGSRVLCSTQKEGARQAVGDASGLASWSVGGNGAAQGGGEIRMQQTMEEVLTRFAADREATCNIGARA